MRVHRTIGIFLVYLVTSACASGETFEGSAFHDPSDATVISQENAEVPTANPRNFSCGVVQECRSAEEGCEQVEQRSANFEFVADRGGKTADVYCKLARALRIRLFGKAAWYNLVGSRTASGELLDTVTPTAAHRWLPLASFAKVTNLDNGRSVILKINDRGPYTRGRILDLSPGAADALDMKHAGVVAVVIEPLLTPVRTVELF
jgi:rare lipoprotein A (peptidoglycan hydrolase)